MDSAAKEKSFEPKISIYDEDHSILIEDDFATNTFDFFPESKHFKRVMSVKDDCFYINETYEYRISPNPINVSMRLVEKSTEPPEKFEVKDGVVLEAEIKDAKILLEDKIADLKKEVEWHELPSAGGYIEMFYILSLHPEIISKDEYRKFLRQIEQKIKLGLANIETRIKDKDKTGLQIIEGEYGKQIWYKDTDEGSDKDQKKRIDYVREKFYTPLFDEKSRDYCGITLNEFKGSTETLKRIELFLDRKLSSTNNPQSVVSPKRRNNTWKWIVVGVLAVIALGWGVWQAVGVFILGAIIINLLSANKS